MSCSNCKGTGIRESTHADDLESVASYCACDAGERRQFDGAVAATNGARERLRIKFKGSRTVRDILAMEAKRRKSRPVEEVYQGEF